MTRLCYFISLILFATQTSSNILIPCDGDADCEAVVPTSVCSAVLGNHCTCPAGFTFSTSVTSCIREALYGETCAEAIQCSHMLTGATCNGNCQCAEGLTYVRGKCRKLVDLNEACRDEIDCFFGHNRESVECRDGKCQCAVGFYQRFNNVCRRESINGEPCIVNADCVESKNCFEKKCASVGTQTSNLVNAAVQTSQSLETISEGRPIKSVKSSSFSSKATNSNIKYRRLDTVDANRFSSPDDEEDVQFGDLCDAENKPCPGLKYSICRRGFCHCQDGFYHRSGVCKAELGEFVEEEADCGAGIFRNNRCVCESDNFYNPHLRSCVKAADGLGYSCTQQGQCTPYGASLCTATADDPFARRCFCHDYARFNNVTQLCEMKQAIGEYCQQAATCKVANTICTTSNTCECKPNYVAQNDEECKPAFGAECEATEDCAFENAECKVEIIDETTTTTAQPLVKTCKCKDEFVDVGNKCLEKAKTYNDTCEESEQCKPLLGDKASCIDNHCTCDESLHYRNGKCQDKKELNDRCSKTAECFVANDPEAVECRNGICQCKLGVTPDTNQNSCIRPREKNSSNKTSPLKVITLALIASAVVITGSALKDAYFP